VSAAGAVDDSGDPLLYTFTARSGDGTYLQVGPQPESAAEFTLAAGDWTISLTVDDDLLCRDRAADATCVEILAVEPDLSRLISHWRLDGSLEDAQESGNDGEFFGEDLPVFVDDRLGNPASALSFDGNDDYLLVSGKAGLPLYAHREFTVAMWVKGPVQDNKRIWSESSSEHDDTFFSIGAQSRAATGQVEVNLRDQNGVSVLAHRLSAGIVLDNTWHHLAWVDAEGDAALYIDGERDPADFSYESPDLPLDTTVIGGLLTETPGFSFEGVIDDVRAYNYGLTAAEVARLAGGQRFHRGDPNDDGNIDITDGIYILGYLFQGGPGPTCAESADADDSGAIDITDGIYLLHFLFQGGPAPAAPGPTTSECGPDPAGSPDLGCEIYTNC
jgi:hypothetical protein